MQSAEEFGESGQVKRLQCKSKYSLWWANVQFMSNMCTLKSSIMHILLRGPSFHGLGTPPHTLIAQFCTDLS